MLVCLYRTANVMIFFHYWHLLTKYFPFFLSKACFVFPKKEPMAGRDVLYIYAIIAFREGIL